MKQDMYDLLIRSFDGNLSREEQSLLEEALRSDQDLRREKQRLAEVRSLIGSQEYEFAPFFATRVMAGIESVNELFSEKLFYVFRRMAVVSLVIVAGLLVGTYLQDGTVTLSTLTGISDLAGGGAESLLLYGWSK